MRACVRACVRTCVRWFSKFFFFSFLVVSFVFVGFRYPFLFFVSFCRAPLRFVAFRRFGWPRRVSFTFDAFRLLLMRFL